MNDIDGPAPSRVTAVQALLLFAVVFSAVYWAVHAASQHLMPLFHLGTLRETAGYRLTTSIVLLWIELAAMLLVLRLRGKTLRDIGWRKPGPAIGWLSGAALAVVYAGYVLFALLKNAPILTDWSFFRIGFALATGLSAGICEEAIFRGFVMTEARDAGAATWLQILLAAVLFGLAHAGWGTTAPNFNVATAIGAMASTTVVGAMLAGVYVLSRRSLMPVIFTHAAIDMVIEPWLILLALSGGLGLSHG